MCYDDGCHLKKYAMNPVRDNQTETATRIAMTNIVIDRLHFKGHIDAWCKENCDPNKFEDLNKVCIDNTFCGIKYSLNAITHVTDECNIF